jgi:hypothetical protein
MSSVARQGAGVPHPRGQRRRTLPGRRAPGRGFPEEITSATTPQQTPAMVKNALTLSVRARWFAGDEVYSRRVLRRSLRKVGLGYTVGESHAYPVTNTAGRQWKARQLINKVLPHQWMHRRTGHGTKGTREPCKSSTRTCLFVDPCAVRGDASLINRRTEQGT